MAGFRFGVEAAVEMKDGMKAADCEAAAEKAFETLVEAAKGLDLVMVKRSEPRFAAVIRKSE